MALEITGRLIKICPEQTGNGKNGTWIKQDFIIETQEQFPKKVCIAAWNDKAEMLGRLATGADLKVSFNIESREFNNKWYTDLKAWRIEAVSGGNIAPAAVSEPSEKSFITEQADDLPF